MAVKIDREKCTNCAKCVEVCPEDVLQLEKNKVVARYPDECWYCGSCTYDCPHDAIDVDFNINLGTRFVEF